VMTTQLDTLPRTAPLEALLPIFAAGRIAIIADQDGFHGLITRVDVITYLRDRYRRPLTDFASPARKDGAAFHPTSVGTFHPATFSPTSVE